MAAIFYLFFYSVLGAPIKKGGISFFYSVQEVGGEAVSGGIGGVPYKKMGFQFFLQISRGPKEPSRRPKATNPPQELEVGVRRAPYLLVSYI